MQTPRLANTVQHIAWYAAHTPDSIAVIEHGTRITYAMLARDLLHAAHALWDFDITAGQLIAVETPHRYQHLLLLLTCELIGVAAASFARRDLLVADPVLRVCDALVAASAPDDVRLPRILPLPRAWPTGNSSARSDPSELVRAQHPVAPGAMTLIKRTSGTTGVPKAIPLTRALQQLRIMRNIERVAGDILPHPRFLCLYNLTVGSVHLRALGVLQHGGTVVFCAEEQASGLIAAGAVNYGVFTVGDMEHLVDRLGAPPPGHRLHVEVFGAAVGPELRRSIRARLTRCFTSKYSSNETNPIAIVDDDGVGKLCPGVAVRIVDDAGSDVPHGTIGRIRVRSETMVQGYFNDPKLTAASFFDGWFQTGDVGRLLSPGELIILGRSDDMLNIGGVKIARLPLEQTLRQIAGVLDVAVLEVPSENGVGRLLVAVEIPADQVPDALLAEIAALVRQHTRRFDVMPLPWFPRSESGKVRRGYIKAAFDRQRHAGAS